MGRFDTPTDKPFAEALGELVRDHDDYMTQTGNVNWHAFARDMEDVHYESLRKALAGRRSVTPRIIEECARVLRIKPTYFAEYRLWEARRDFDVSEVGFETALSNLDRWSADQEAAAKKKAAARKTPRRRP